MNKNDEKFIKKLFAESLKNPPGKCPSEEDISALVDGVLKEDEKNELMKHISKCSRCYEVYTTVLDLTGRENIKRLRIFNPFSIAASIFIVVISLIIFYKINVKEKVDLMNNISESAEIVGKSLPEESEGSSPEKFKYKETEEFPLKKEGHKESAPEPGTEKKIKMYEQPVIKTGKIEDEVSEESAVLRSVLSKSEVRAYSSQSRGKDSRIQPGKTEVLKKEKGQENIRKKGGLIPEYYKNVPEIKKIIHLSDIDGYSEVKSGESILVEFKIKQDGTVVRICILKGGGGRIQLIKKALSGWVFSPVKTEYMRFTVDLFLNEEGKFKLLK